MGKARMDSGGSGSITISENIGINDLHRCSSESPELVMQESFEQGGFGDGDGSSHSREPYPAAENDAEVIDSFAATSDTETDEIISARRSQHAARRQTPEAMQVEMLIAMGATPLTAIGAAGSAKQASQLASFAQHDPASAVEVAWS